MKKIIAAAVATAFVAPAFAADVSLSGDVEYRFNVFENDGVSSTEGDTDFKITATEEVNGIGIEAVINHEKTGSSKGYIGLSGASFGSVKIGTEVDPAIQNVDEVATIGEVGAQETDVSLTDAEADQTILVTFPTVVDGLTVMASYSAITNSATINDAASTNEKQSSSVALSYTMGGMKVNYGRASGDALSEDVVYTGVSYSTGPFLVAYDATENNNGTATSDATAYGIQYSYGPGRIYLASSSTDNGTAESTDTAAGITYNIGAVNMYVESQDGDDEDARGTVFGMEYAF